MEFDQQLSEDFLFLLDLFKNPEQVFPLDSKELQLTQLWLNHLSLYECENLQERRIVNMYMSHLCAALGEGKLYGPFLREPPRGKLEKVDFHAETPNTNATISPMLTTKPIGWPETPPGSMSSTAPMLRGDSQMDDSGIDYAADNHSSNNEPKESMKSTALASQGQITVGSTKLLFNVSTGGDMPPSLCPCPPKPCECGKSGSGSVCNCQRSSAGAETNDDLPHDDKESVYSYHMQDLMNSNTALNSFTDVGRGKMQDPSHSSHTFLPQSQQASVVHIPDMQPSRPQSMSPASKEMYEDICELIAAISAELRGDVEPGNSDYLERELARYNHFVMSNSELAQNLRTLSSQMKLRHFLLLGLQNDLVKLLSDFVSSGGAF